MAVVQTGLLFGLLLWKVHFIDQRFVITRSERVWSCWVERLGRGVRRVRGSTGPTTGIGSPQHVRAVKSPRPSFFVSSPCSLMSISVKFAIYNCLGLCTSLLLFCLFLSFLLVVGVVSKRVCLRFCSHYCYLECRLSFPTPSLLFVNQAPEPWPVSYLKGTLPRLPGA